MILKWEKGKDKALIVGIILLLLCIACYFSIFSKCDGSICLNLIWFGMAVYGVFLFSIGLISFNLISRIKSNWLKMLFVVIAALFIMLAVFSLYV